MNNLSVANAILDEAERQGIPVTPMQLQKLVYFTNGWHMEIFDGRPIFADSFEAWQFGPVMPAIYHDFKQYGSRKITGRATNPFTRTAWVADFLETKTALISAIIRIYGRLSGPKMSHLTHKQGTPWFVTWKGGVGSGTNISNQLILAEFQRIRQEQALLND